MVLVNTSRAVLVEEQDILCAIESGKLGGYLTDVLAEEPMADSCLLRNKPKVLITPHIGSRTHETIQRQVFKTITLPTCLPPQTQRPKDSDFEKYFLRKCGDFPGTDLPCINILSVLTRLLAANRTSPRTPAS